MSNSATLPYVRIPSPFPTFRPLLPIELRNGKHSVPEIGLVDSGSYTSVLPWPIGLNLGLNWNRLPSLPPASGAFSKTPTRAALLEVAIAPFAPVRLVFAWIQRDDVPLIFGQTNFFLVFDVCTFGSQNTFQIQPRTP